ncbi:MAG: Maf family protein [Clostridiales bacterium]|nr:Maf family protein [Clostridiales bacterium]
MPETQNEQEVLYAASYPAEVVKALAFGKAEAVAEQIPEGIIIGSDTIVWDNEIMGKPEDRADAYRMLRQLQGRIHSVFTGVAVLVKDENDVKKHIFYSETKVEVYPMTETETKAYLDTGEPMDKAGAYGIQGKFGLWVKGIEGDYNSVVGLPLSALWQVLKEYV